MTKTELKSKHLADLHALAAEAGVPRYRMLTRAELIEKLSDGESGSEAEPAPEPAPSRDGGDRPRRRRRRSGSRRPDGEREADSAPAEAPAEPSEAKEEKETKEDRPQPPRPSPGAAPTAERPRRRRRRRFGRRRDKGIGLRDLLLPPEPGRQTVLCAESREACTALLRSVAADLSGASKGPDPIALLIDPSPEELADWKREAPQAEIVSAGQARHADDALAAAAARASGGDDVILLIDSLNRLAEAYGDSEAAKEFFDSGRLQGAEGGGSLTVVAALERTG